MKNFNYKIETYWAEESKAYFAKVPAFPGLLAFGATEKEAVKEAIIAVKAMIKVLEENGRPIPEQDEVE